MRSGLIPFLILAAAAVAGAEPSSAQVSEAPKQDLAEFEGLYEYRDGGTLYMVRDDRDLFAIIGASKYRLRPVGPDTFLNPPGDSIPFERDARGHISAFKEYGVRFARLSRDVPASARSLLKARPDGPDGTPVEYRYAPPPQLGDGIPVARAEETGFSPKLAEQLVNGVINGTYPDVHSLLIFSARLPGP